MDKQHVGCDMQVLTAMCGSKGGAWASNCREKLEEVKSEQPKLTHLSFQVPNFNFPVGTASREKLGAFAEAHTIDNR